MEVKHFDWGGSEVSNEELNPIVQRLLEACVNNSSCEVIQLRAENIHKTQTIIADFADGSFALNNGVGINRVERLALTFSPEAHFRWEVRALRGDFPVTLHQNHTPKGDPRSLCLYIEPWTAVERTWTPELFLKRIFWWLRATAEETIHRDDQPIEHLFFHTPFNIILPKDHFSSEETLQKKLLFDVIQYNGLGDTTLVAKYANGRESTPTHSCFSVSVILEPIENGPVEGYPDTLGALEDLLIKRKSPIIPLLKDAISNLMSPEGIEIKADKLEFVMLLLGIPRIRNGLVEKTETQGFMIDVNVGVLGESLGVLLKAPEQNKWYRDHLSQNNVDKWRYISLFPVNVKCYPTSQVIREYSDIAAGDQGPKGVIAGVGALGGLLAKIWNRECWGKWSYVDDDILKPHNITRHIAVHQHIGYPKSVVVEAIVNHIHASDLEKTNQAFISSVLSEEKNLKKTINEAEILIDATTTLHVPRTISADDDFPRTVSVFISPSGMSSVMLLENKNRTIRCNSLEAQYYREILMSNWGKSHLAGHVSQQWIGTGCREVTLSISDELIHIHAATLSRQLRKNLINPNAVGSVWEYIDETGSIVHHDIPIFPSHSIQVNEWTIVWDDGFLSNTKKHRVSALPNETGGILFGIVDQKDASITLVKACSAPTNSLQSPSSFTRGAYENTSILDDCHERTTGIVTYVGEWHSHPPGCGPLPSKDDIGQLNFLSSSLQIEGIPALMMIVSEESIGYYISDSGVIVSL
jgi:integrative and conjugative element protein (TIGR02256 family)